MWAACSRPHCRLPPAGTRSWQFDARCASHMRGSSDSFVRSRGAQSHQRLKEMPEMDRTLDQALTEMLRIERSLWENDVRVYHDTYTPDAVLIFPGIGRIDREAAVAAIQKE